MSIKIGAAKCFLGCLFGFAKKNRYDREISVVLSCVLFIVCEKY